MSRSQKVVLKELVDEGRFWQYWYGAVPSDHARFKVTDQDWTGDLSSSSPVRHIYAWELADGEEGEEGSGRQAGL